VKREALCEGSMRYSVTYDIVRDGDRSLRGKIAELVFERVKSLLLGKALYCCNTLDLHDFLASRLVDISSIDGRSLLYEYTTNLNAVRDLLGLGKFEGAFNVLSNQDVRKNLRKLCLFCLKEAKTPVFIEADGLERAFFTCKECFAKCVEKGLLQAVPVHFSDLSGRRLSPYTRYFVNFEKKPFRHLVHDLLRISDLLKYLDVVEVLSRLDERARGLLREVYGERSAPGQHPFDYVCVDDRGSRYLVDVTSVRGIGKRPPPLSKRERQVAERARREGFRILVPLVRFLQDWRILVELIEV
jgi:hypothetical protein